MWSGAWQFQQALPGVFLSLAQRLLPLTPPQFLSKKQEKALLNAPSAANPELPSVPPRKKGIPIEEHRCQGQRAAGTAGQPKMLLLPATTVRILRGFRPVAALPTKSQNISTRLPPASRNEGVSRRQAASRGRGEDVQLSSAAPALCPFSGTGQLVPIRRSRGSK